MTERLNPVYGHRVPAFGNLTQVGWNKPGTECSVDVTGVRVKIPSPLRPCWFFFSGDGSFTRETSQK
jgi:hypothetical protein